MEQESRLKAIYTRLSPREKRLLIVWVFAMMGILVFIVTVKIKGAIEDRRTGIESYQATLKLIQDRQDEYVVGQKGSGTKPLKERIDENTIKLQTFLDAEAMRFDLKINNFKEQSLPVGGKRPKKGEPVAVVEESVTIEIENADYKKFAQFVDKISRAPELLVIKRIHIEKARRSASNIASDANPREVRVTMTVSTYKKGES